MKINRLLIVVLVLANAVVVAVAQNSWSWSDWNDWSYFFDEAEESEIELYASKHCYNGGAGASSCTIDAGIELEAGISASCSVTCGQGYYACCGILLYLCQYHRY